MIDINDMTFAYEKANGNVFNHFELHINQGEFVTVTGESGCGKSTLIRLLLNDLVPGDGSINVMGYELEKLNPKKLSNYRKQIGVVFQDTKLLEDRNVYDNLLFAAQVLGLGKKAAVNKITSILSMLGIADLFQRMPEQLSGGQKQKVCMARALIANPGILLCDEPTGNLDPDSSEEFMKLLWLIHLQGTTIVMVTHDLLLIDKYPGCRRVELASC